MDLGIYDLFNDYAGIFQEANENNIEVILIFNILRIYNHSLIRQLVCLLLIGLLLMCLLI